MKKFIAALMTAVTMLFGSVQLQPENIVSAEEYEKNILISCESKEIDINDIPENREVELNVSIENNPGFMMLGMYLKYDLRLELIEEYYICQGYEGANNIIYEPIAFFDDDMKEYVKIQVTTRDLLLSKNDEAIMKLIFRIPADCQIDDVYKIEFIKNSDITTFCFVPNQNEMFREEYFLDPNNGMIKITGNNIINSTEESIQSIKYEPEVIDEPVSVTTEKIIAESNAFAMDVTDITYVTTILSTSMSESILVTMPPEEEISAETIPSTSIGSITQLETLSVTGDFQSDEDGKKTYVFPIALSAMMIVAFAVVLAKRKRSK